MTAVNTFLSYRGLTIALQPGLPSELYNDFAQNNQGQLEYVIDCAYDYYIQCIEVTSDGALIHYKSPGSPGPIYPTQMVKVDWEAEE